MNSIKHYVAECSDSRKLRHDPGKEVTLAHRELCVTTYQLADHHDARAWEKHSEIERARHGHQMEQLHILRLS